MSFLHRTAANHALRLSAMALGLGVIVVAATGPLSMLARPAAAAASPAGAYPTTSALRSVALRGPATALTGDLLQIGDQRVRLFGVRAAEAQLHCRSDRGEPLSAGAGSVSALAALVRGRTVACERLGRAATGEWVGYCEAADMDLGGRQVNSGWARNDGTHTQSYLMPEARARQLRVGVWACNHLSPAAFRASVGTFQGT